jgi:hypothetical protein
LVYKEGDTGRELFVVRTGSVGTQIQDFLSQRNTHVTDGLGPGAGFGDAAVADLYHKRDNAMVLPTADI